MTIRSTTAAARHRDGRGSARTGHHGRRERLRLLLRSPTFLAGSLLVGFWISARSSARASRPRTPFTGHPQQAPGRRPVSTGSERTGSGATSSRASSRAPATSSSSRRSPRCSARSRARPSASSPDTSAASSTTSIMRLVDAFLALPIVMLGLLALVALGASRGDGDPRDRLRLRADHRPHRARRRTSASASSTTSRRRGCATSALPTSCSPRSSRTSRGRSWSSSRCGWATRSSPSPRSPSSASASSRPRPTGACRSPRTTASSAPALVARALPRPRHRDARRRQ